jgi:hypothetical protein
VEEFVAHLVAESVILHSLTDRGNQFGFADGRAVNHYFNSFLFVQGVLHSLDVFGGHGLHIRTKLASAEGARESIFIALTVATAAWENLKMADEENELMTEIVRLQRQVSALTEIADKLYILSQDPQRFRPETETAFQAIKPLLDHTKNPNE